MWLYSFCGEDVGTSNRDLVKDLLFLCYLVFCSLWLRVLASSFSLIRRKYVLMGKGDVCGCICIFWCLFVHKVDYDKLLSVRVNNYGRSF